MNIGKKLAAVATVVAVLSAAGIAGATVNSILVRAGGHQPGVVKCPGGMTRLGHEFNEDISVFPGDPAVHIDLEYTVAADFFRVEDIDLGSHAGTHLDAPKHFIEGGRGIDDLRADEFVWPAYKMDVRGMTFENNMIQEADIRAYEREHGRIKPGSLVVLRTGAEEFFGAESVVTDSDGNADNVDDIFDFRNAGFSGEAVQFMFDKRRIDGVGSDAYGPDAFGDLNFSATYTTLANDGVALVAIANLDSVSVRNDVIMAPTVALSDGSGYSTDPIACHGSGR